MFRLSVAMILCLHSGCAGEAKLKVCRVQGRLIVDGRPAANANLAFHRQGDAVAAVVCPVAKTRSDGSYRLTTFASGDGAPPGEYVVTLVWPDPDEPFDECECLDFRKHDLFKGRYSNPSTSNLRVTVRPEANDIPLYALLIEPKDSVPAAEESE